MLIGTFIVAVILGVASAMAPLGPVTLLVLRRGMEEDWTGGLKVGLGRVVPEMIYCGLATFGAARAIATFPSATLWIQAIGAVLLLSLGSYFAFARMEARPADAPRPRWGNWSGFIIASLNPALILSWTAIAAIAITTTGIKPNVVQKLTYISGIGMGVALGYVALIGTMKRWGHALNAQFIRTVIRIVGFGFIAASVWNIVQLATRL